MTEGLNNISYAVLRQEVDPLEWCVVTLPIPCKYGVPIGPCEQSNEFKLYQSDETYKQLGMKIYDCKESSTCLNRACCMPSMREFSMECADFYNNKTIYAEKPFKIPCLKKSRPEYRVSYEDEYIGRIVEPCNYQLCNGKFHEIFIENANGEKIYNIIAKLEGNVCLWLPEKMAKKQITYKIFQEDDGINEVGEIQHMHYGVFNEFCSKADQYGITYPDNATVQEKVLITMATIFIDYQWFENS